MTHTEIVSNRYSGRNRIQRQDVYYNKSDDLYSLGNLYRQLESVLTQIEAKLERGEDVTQLRIEETKLREGIAQREEYIAGYPEENEENNGNDGGSNE